jgi:asparagine synthase (glutamine-hydrolysing)
MDYRLVELAFQLPATMKLNKGRTKYILRQAMNNILPAQIVNKRRKRRFEVPYASWLRGPWRSKIESLFLQGSCQMEKYLDYFTFRRKLRAYLDGDDRAICTFTLWRIVQTDVWLSVFAGVAPQIPGSPLATNTIIGER